MNRAAFPVFFCALLLCAGMSPSSGARMMEIADLPSIVNARSLAVSPAGGVAAYVVNETPRVLEGEEDGTGIMHLYVVRSSARPVLFATVRGRISDVRFSADGKSILFLADREDDEYVSVYSISLDGGEARKVFAHVADITAYALSPDGARLFFVATGKEPEYRKERAEKGFNAYAYEEQIPFASVWTAGLHDGESEASILYDGGHVSAIELSPDGRWIAAAVAPSPLIDDNLIARDIRVLNARTGTVRSTVDVPGKLGGFRISPDSSRIAFHGAADTADPSTGVLTIADMDTGVFRQIDAGAAQHVMDVEWTDKDEILAVVHRGLSGTLWVYAPDGSVKRVPDISAALIARDVAAGGGSVFMIADSPSHPREVFSVGASGAGRTGNHNEWLDDVDLAEQRPFSYEARDGRQIEGVLLVPAGRRKPRRGWPLVLGVHGGPESHFSNGWVTRYADPGQFAAARGYAVFYPNYRGSTGRGVAFSKEHQDDYAGKEFDDLVDAVEALSGAGLVDRRRVGITGGSYGGYAAMWGATAFSDYFAASVAFVGISNQISKFGTSDIPREMYYVHSLRWPWEDNWLNLLERSPLYHAGRSSTPLLILHGEKDTRVHPSQSMELYRSIKLRTAVPVRLVLYPDEGHGNRSAAAQMDYAYRMMRWMDTYLADADSRMKPLPPFEYDPESIPVSGKTGDRGRGR